ncbi:hypothetical protein Pfo_027303 [Paulownia fortunei]|nr:hypothetical protein Pfo_027303 [Paulownia fortunei]
MHSHCSRFSLTCLQKLFFLDQDLTCSYEICDWNMARSEFSKISMMILISSEEHAITLAMRGLLGVVSAVATLIDEAMDVGEFHMQLLANAQASIHYFLPETMNLLVKIIAEDLNDQLVALEYVDDISKLSKAHREDVNDQLGALEYDLSSFEISDWNLARSEVSKVSIMTLISRCDFILREFLTEAFCFSEDDLL